MDSTSHPDRATTSKAEILHSLASGPLASSISTLSASVKLIPSDQDFHFFNNFDEFKLPINSIAKKSESLLKSITFGRGALTAFPSGADHDDAYEWLVNLNDEIFERADISLDEFQRSRKKDEGLGPDADGFQMVFGKKKKKSIVRVASKDAKRTGERSRVSFHIPSIPRPQDVFGILVNNSNQPFEHVWLQRSEDDGRFIHPLEKLSEADFIDRHVEDAEPVNPLPLESTPFQLVEGVKELKELAAKLRVVNEFAVDLEHNQYRSFQGLTCLMQISTRTEDFVVDTLKLRIHVGPHLREVFKDPFKRKVMHGADRDILWLQRDFGIYVCNLFDTGQASRVLQLERNSLEYLLHHFCEITANKEYQNADWRLRPLPDEMIKYAREDTHYLLHIYDLMKGMLHSASTQSERSDDLLLEVYKRSYDICMQLYEKELLIDTSYLHIYGLQGANFNSEQLAIVSGLCEWRDTVARQEDESTGYVLPNKSLLEIARQMLTSSGQLRRLVKSKHPFVEQNLGSVVNVIKNSIANAAAFESASEQLRKGRVENALGKDTDAAAIDGEVEPLSRKTASGQGGSLNGINNQRAAEYMEVSTDMEQKTRNVYCGGDHPSVSLSETACLGEQYGEARTETSNLVKAASIASVQMLKKPSSAFGAMLGHSAFKGKLYTNRKGSSFEQDKAEMKVEQIKSSVTLPFHSFLGGSQRCGQAAESMRCSRPQHPETTQSTCPEPADHAKLEEIIPLENNLNKQESSPDTPTANELENGETRDSTSADELADLSSSFQKVIWSNQKRNLKQMDSRTHEPNSCLTPFDYAAARKQKRFGDGIEEQQSTENHHDVSSAPSASVETIKGSVSSLAHKKEVNKEFPRVRRRQAFPASGNRSATFL